MKDVHFVEDILAQFIMKRDDIQRLFTTLGLSEITVGGFHEIHDKKQYAHGLLVAWRNEQDDVLKSTDYPGGPTWENLRKALTDIGHLGTANRLQ